ncbi:MAG: methyltransferase family protein [Woeseiaceae bacterium]
MKHKIPPPIILALSGIAAWFVAKSEYAFTVDIPYALVPAVILAAAGFYVAGTALRQFKSAETTVNPLQPDAASSLVDAGIFSRTRNPMYLGLLLVLSGWVIWLQSAGNFLVLVLFVLYINELQIKPEEAALRKLFGQAYVDYCKRVRRWV